MDMSLDWRKKYKTDIRYADYVAVLLKTGEKLFIDKWHSEIKYDSDLIERELNSQEYMDFIWDKGFTCDIAPRSGVNVAPSFASHWNNEPSEIIEILQGGRGIIQPLITCRSSISKAFPTGNGTELYNFKLQVETPTEFWHYKFKKSNG